MGETLNNHPFWNAKTLNQRVMYEGNRTTVGNRPSAKSSLQIYLMLDSVIEIRPLM